MFRLLTIAIAVTAGVLPGFSVLGADDTTAISSPKHAKQGLPANAYLMSGNANFRSGGFQAAHDDYITYLHQLAKPDPSVLARLALCDAWSGGKEQAEREFEQAATLSGPGITADLDRIDASIVGQKYDEAIKRAKETCRHYPTAWRAFWRLGFINDKYCDYADAVAAYTKAIELFPKGRGGDWEEICGAPVEKQLYSLRSQCNYWLQDYAACIKDCDKVAELKPDEQIAYEARAEAKLQLHDVPGAMADLKTAVALNSKRARTYKQLGMCQLQLGDATSAIASLTKAISIFDGYGEAYHLRSQAFKLVGKFSEATSDEQKARRFGFHAESSV